MEESLASLSALTLLGLGFVFGLKHATEADHVVAVSTIVSKERKVLRSALVGGLWGAGHTVALIIVGVIVLVLRIAVPERVSNWLEFGVAVMIIGLGIAALVKAFHGSARSTVGASLRGRPASGEHNDNHNNSVPTHTHAVSRIGLKPFLVGAMHGLAGSAALTLLVLTQIKSIAMGLMYLLVFGIGSIFGMLLMSGLIGLPFALSSHRLNGVNYGLQTIAGVLSISFGFWYAYQVGTANGFWNAIL